MSLTDSPTLRSLRTPWYSWTMAESRATANSSNLRCSRGVRRSLSSIILRIRVRLVIGMYFSLSKYIIDESNCYLITENITFNKDIPVIPDCLIQYIKSIIHWHKWQLHSLYFMLGRKLLKIVLYMPFYNNHCNILLVQLFFNTFLLSLVKRLYILILILIFKFKLK